MNIKDIDFKLLIKSHSNLIIIIGSVILSVVIATVLFFALGIFGDKTEYGYQEVLTQIKNGSYEDPTTGNLVVSESGWIVNLQPFESVEEPIINIAKKYDKKDEIKFFVGHKVDMTNKTITYAFLSIDETATKYTLYAVQDINNKITYNIADYSDIDEIFTTTRDDK